MNKTQEALKMAIEQIKWADHLHDWHDGLYEALETCKEALAELQEQNPVYTSPQPREWAGLSDMQITNIGMQHQSLHQVAYAISDALKQLNTKG